MATRNKTNKTTVKTKSAIVEHVLEDHDDFDIEVYVFKFKDHPEKQGVVISSLAGKMIQATKIQISKAPGVNNKIALEIFKPKKQKK